MNSLALSSLSPPVASVFAFRLGIMGGRGQPDSFKRLILIYVSARHSTLEILNYLFFRFITQRRWSMNQINISSFFYLLTELNNVWLKHWHIEQRDAVLNLNHLIIWQRKSVFIATLLKEIVWSTLTHRLILRFWTYQGIQYNLVRWAPQHLHVLVKVLVLLGF